MSWFPVVSGDGRYVAFLSNLPLTKEEDAPASAVFGMNGMNAYIWDVKSQETQLVSKTLNDLVSLGAVYDLAISDNGRYVAFSANCLSAADPLESDPLAGVCIGRQVFVRDLKREETIQVSKTADGASANGISVAPSISGNGRYIVFSSTADNLVSNDSNNLDCLSSDYEVAIPSCFDVFRHDMRVGKTELVSVTRDGRSGNESSKAYDGQAQSTSDDGRYIAFYSLAKDLVPVDSSPFPHNSALFVRDMEAERTERVSVSSNGEVVVGGNWMSISDNGRYVLVAGNTCSPPIPNVMASCDREHASVGNAVFDRRTGQRNWVTATTDDQVRENIPPDAKMFAETIGGNGRFILGVSDRDDVVDGDRNESWDVFLRDLGAENLGVRVFRGRPTSSSRAASAQLPGGSVTCINATCSRSQLLGKAGSAEMYLYGASIVQRTDLSDLFVKIELEHMPKVLPGVSPIFYGLHFEVEDRSYEARATSLLGGTFGLFDCTDSRPACTKVADLRGGYGTTGMRVVFSIPLEEMGLAEGGKLKHVEAFSALGSDLSGATKVLDRVTLK